MTFSYQKSGNRGARQIRAGFTLIEILITFVILGMVLAGLIYGYVQANRMAEWCSMSMAAQSLASEGAEKARAADWRPRDWPMTQGYEGSSDELTNGWQTNYLDFMDVPSRGILSATNFNVTNFVSITNIGSGNPPLRQIRSDAVWTFPWDGKLCTNTVILVRTGDQ
jgi:prepilin-type N-terminal cleavage/methylation domain-containing protein